MSNIINSIKSEFTTRTWVLMVIAIAINIAIGQIIVILKLPIYLDSIGTVLVGALVGPWAGMLTGALANIIWGLTGLYPEAIAFFYVAAVIGLLAGIAGKLGLFEKTSPRWLSTIIGGLFFFTLTLFVIELINLEISPDGYPMLPNAGDVVQQNLAIFIIITILGMVIGYFFMANAAYAGLSGLITGIIAAIISAPTAAVVFGGVTGAGTDLLVAAFRASGAGIMQSTFAQGAVSDPLDKMISFLIVWAIIQALPMRYKTR
ncbi:MAG: hypothetical protein ACWGN2_10630 [Anaerolineales bacterium]